MSLFQNYKVALAFAGTTLLGAVIFVGTGEGGGGLQGSVKDLAGKREEVASPSESLPEAKNTRPANEQPIIQDFTPDEELIDSASGSDPNPDRPKRAATPKDAVVAAPAQQQSAGGLSTVARPAAASGDTLLTDSEISAQSRN